MDRLVGAATIEKLKRETFPAGLRDVADWFGTSLTFRRRNASTGVFADVGTVKVISVKLDSNTSTEAPGDVETTTTGALKVWAADFEAAPINQDDRFNWDGHPCVVTMVQPTKIDTYVAIMFRVLEVANHG